MPRLPQVGQDDGVWGNILNEYLQVAHENDGTLKPVAQSQIVGLTQALDAKVSHAQVVSKANDADLAAVAKTGSYNDLSNKPTIPTQASDVGAVSSTSLQAVERLTQAQYDAMETHDPTTLYIVVG